jgi:HD-GYP domain-containing protein (c-di-GMP phosphodiesterase class II)
MICMAAGRELGFDKKRLLTLAGTALLHDIVRPQGFLFTDQETPSIELLRKHCQLGQVMIDLLPFPSPTTDFIIYHHEFADGSGPFGKKADEVPIESALIGLAGFIEMFMDFDNVSTFGLEHIESAIRTLPFKRFDPRAVDVVRSVLNGELIHLLRKDVILTVCRSSMPKYRQILTNEEIYDVGIFMCILVGFQSEYTRLHTEQMASIAWQLGRIRGYDEDLLARLYLAASMHDCGKLTISGQMLDKKEKLTQAEMEVVKTHALISFLEIKEMSGMREIACWAGNHHERLDGSGYPHGYHAAELDEQSQLLEVCDVYEATGAVRPYHHKRKTSEVETIIRSLANQNKLNKEMVEQACGFLHSYRIGRVPPPDQISYRKLRSLEKLFRKV